MQTRKTTKNGAAHAPVPSSPNDGEKSRTTRVYLAGPLFTVMERRANRELARLIEQEAPAIRVVLPQDLKHDDRYNDQRAFGFIFKGCVDAIDTSHCMLAWLDGPDADSGTCFEVGYAFAKGMPVIGLRTDFRSNQERGVNIMLSRACKMFVYRPSFDEDLEATARDVVRAIRKIAAKQNGKDAKA